MACFHPVVAWRAPISGYGKKQILSFQYNSPGPKWTRVELPCNHCIGCHMDYSRQWANRCLLEMQYHSSTMFLTLTYDDTHVPRTFTVDPSTGEVIAPAMTLRSRDFTLFVKRLRKRFPDQSIRYFGCGEYGSKSFRPHYHIIVFGLILTDLTPVGQSVLGYPYYDSEMLSSCWSSGKRVPYGRIVVTPASWETCAYVARYVLKKQGPANDRKMYDRLGIEPPFLRMSRRPGIGRAYYDEHPDVCQWSDIFVSTSDGGRKMPIPKYFRRLYKDVDPISSDWYAIERETSTYNSNEIVENVLTNKDHYDILKDKERRTISKLTALPRKEV